MTSPPERNRLELLALPIDDLYREVGLRLPADEDPAGIKEPIARARGWLLRKREEIREVVCAPDKWPALRATLDGTHLDEAVLAMLEGCLATRFGGYPVVTISVLLLREGFERVCGCD